MSHGLNLHSSDGMIAKQEAPGVLISHGTSVPADGAAGYAPSSVFIKNDSTAGLYVNVGSKASANFDPLAAAAPIADAGNFTSQTTVEGALQEIYQTLESTQGAVLFSVNDARLASTAGAVLGAASFGGLLASDTAPSLGATNGTQAITWAANDLGTIVFQSPLPPDFDGSADVNLALTVSSGTTNAANFSIRSSWDLGAQVVDTASDTASNQAHVTTVTIAAADIPDAASNVTLTLTAPTHTTNAISLYGAKLLYKKKLLTS